MQLFGRKKSNDFVKVKILHQRPNNQKHVDFLRVYRVKKDPKINIKNTMTKAFKKAHPDWHISKVALKKEK